MTAEEVFARYIRDDILYLSDNEWVGIEKFKELFAVESHTYDNYIQIDAGVMGYKPFFDQCKTDGNLV